MKFENMNIQKSVLGSLNKIGFENPTKIQTETIPIIKEGHDVIGQSETGSGKTGAFGIPLVEKVSKGGKVQALVLAPTRELAKQIANDFEKFSQFKGLHIEAIYGGVSINPQINGLRSAEIVVGTPGRILDHMRRGTLKTDNIKMFVLDEADKMIDMGFIDDIQTIESQIPKDRQTLLFSATMPESLMRMREKFTEDAKKVKTSSKVREDVLKQSYYDVKRHKKFSLLAHLIKNEDPNLAIVFCNTRRDTDVVSFNLRKQRIKSSALHGGLSQNKRERVMEDFHKGKVEVLVATDVASRGLDVNHVTHVFNYSIPRNSEDYANRIGRTARAGKSGKAITLLSEEDHESFRRVINKFSYDIEKKKEEDFKNLPFMKKNSRRRHNSRRYKKNNYRKNKFRENRQTKPPKW